MEKFVILDNYPYSTTLNIKDFRKIRNLCVKYDLHDRYLPVYEGIFRDGNYRQIGEIDLIYNVFKSKKTESIDSFQECQYPTDYIDVEWST